MTMTKTLRISTHTKYKRVPNKNLNSKKCNKNLKITGGVNSRFEMEEERIKEFKKKAIKIIQSGD
jgi:hypothetical protein